MPLDRRTLANDWPVKTEEPRLQNADEIWVEVYSSEDATAVDLLTQQLETRGISTRVATAVMQVMEYYSSERHTYKKLSVWSGDLDRAIEIIHSLSSASVARRSEVDSSRLANP
jgi:hypothetical protein